MAASRELSRWEPKNEATLRAYSMQGLHLQRQEAGMVAYVVYCAGAWKKASMDGATCDRHSYARAQAKVILPSGGVLFVCGHCSQTLNFGDDYLIEHEAVTV